MPDKSIVIVYLTHGAYYYGPFADSIVERRADTLGAHFDAYTRIEPLNTMQDCIDGLPPVSSE